jgi:pantothenate kinase
VSATAELDALVRRAGALIGDTRRILGIAGPPGAGKSTLAAYLAEQLGPQSIVVPMDGYHLADVELRRLGRTERKGAPDTFDPGGFVALLRRLREPTGEVVYAPGFERAIEQPIAGSIPVDPTISLIITEGNYLLHDDGLWRGVRPQLDECWWIDLDGQPRRQRLIERHRQFGKSRTTAQRWVDGSDEVNARAVRTGIQRADLVVRGDLPDLVTDSQPN